MKLSPRDQVIVAAVLIVVIAGGFWILVLSEFLPTAYFGGLVGFTMLGTLAADLLLLPALLITFKPFGKSIGIK